MKRLNRILKLRLREDGIFFILMFLSFLISFGKFNSISLEHDELLGKMVVYAKHGLIGLTSLLSISFIGMVWSFKEFSEKHRGIRETYKLSDRNHFTMLLIRLGLILLVQMGFSLSGFSLVFYQDFKKVEVLGYLFIFTQFTNLLLVTYSAFSAQLMRSFKGGAFFSSRTFVSFFALINTFILVISGMSIAYKFPEATYKTFELASESFQLPFMYLVISTLLSFLFFFMTYRIWKGES